MANEKSATLSLDRYSPDARGWVVAAQSLADDRGHEEVTPLHLLARALERHPGIVEVFRKAGANTAEMQAEVDRALAALPKARGAAYLSTRLLDLLGRADRDADHERSREVSVEHLLGALAQEIRGPAGEVLSAQGIGPGSLRPYLAALRSLSREAPFREGGEASAPELRDLVKEARAAAGDPVIGRDAELRRLITILERREKNHPLLVGEPGVGKRAVVRALARRLAQGDVPTRLSTARLLAVDVGALSSGARARSDLEARVRKLVESASSSGGEPILVFAGLEQLALQPAGGAGDALRPLFAKGTLRLLATTNAEGLRRLTEKDAALAREFTVLEVAEPSTDRAVEIVRGVASRFESHHGVHISESAVGCAVSLAKRYLADRALPDAAIDLLDESAAALRVETDGVPQVMDRAIGRLESLQAQIASLEGAPDERSRTTRERLQSEAASLGPSVAEMRKRLESRRGAVAAVRMLTAELAAARASLEDARAKKEPARAGELEHATIPSLAERLARAEEGARTSGASTETAVLGEEHVAATLAEWTGIPVNKMLEAEADKLLRMEERLEERVVGQSEGVRALARAVRRGRVGLRDPRRPIGSFLFLGPSGVGKTELAKALAEFLFDDEAALTRLDMSEFMERHMAQRLLGAPPGYADSEQGGFLTEAVRKRPYSVLLFDEVEKAHQDVFNLLLQVLDDGRLTDGRGRPADFTNTVVIMTSNIGSERILQTDERLFDSDDGREALRDVLLDQLGKFFRPEFLNRVDDVIVFRPLSREHLARIVDLQLSRVRALLPEGVTLNVDDAAKARLVELGYQPALGARPLRRAILKHVQDPLAEKLLDKALAAGSALTLKLEGDELVLEASSSR
ncbi:MAG TPA: AAA family ATPase [Polyangiaceae bacterium]|nr:AAA family ATPase [Polyangiaceae bacterium]